MKNALDILANACVEKNMHASMGVVSFFDKTAMSEIYVQRAETLLNFFTLSGHILKQYTSKLSTK